jgi:hypothetical protein
MRSRRRWASARISELSRVAKNRWRAMRSPSRPGKPITSKPGTGRPSDQTSLLFLTSPSWGGRLALARRVGGSYNRRHGRRVGAQDAQEHDPPGIQALATSARTPTARISLSAASSDQELHRRFCLLSPKSDRRARRQPALSGTSLAERQIAQRETGGRRFHNHGIWNNEVDTNLEGVFDRILHVLETSRPPTSASQSDAGPPHEGEVRKINRGLLPLRQRWIEDC